jgi:hypothetical protein
MTAKPGARRWSGSAAAPIQYQRARSHDPAQASTGLGRAQNCPIVFARRRWPRRAGTDRPDIEKAQALVVARDVEESLACSQYEGVDQQPHLVDEVVFDQCLHELATRGYEDVTVQCSFRFETPFTTSSVITVVLFQSGSARVEDTTYLGMLFNLPANWPVRERSHPHGPDLRYDHFDNGVLPWFGLPRSLPTG